MDLFRMIRVALTLSIFSTLNLPAQDFELVQPESYAVRRFAEVVKSQLSDTERKDNAEILIELRAQLAVSNRRLDQIQSLGDPKASDGTLLPLTPENSYRAARALRDHYQKKLERLERTARKKSSK